MKTISAFFMGVIQFKHGFTDHYDDMALRDAYDLGRELTHKITCRKFETD
jgi:hypothetical protein